MGIPPTRRKRDAQIARPYGRYFEFFLDEGESLEGALNFVECDTGHAVATIH